MMNLTSLPLVDFCKVVMACSPSPLTGGAGDGDYVSLKGYSRCTIIIEVDNATTVTGGVVTLEQATTVAGGSAKALAFSRMYANLDTVASDTLVETAVTSNTFTTTTVDNKDSLYVIEVKASDLDIDNGFDCLRVDVASMANAVGSALYILHGARYSSPIATAAITD